MLPVLVLTEIELVFDEIRTEELSKELRAPKPSLNTLCEAEEGTAVAETELMIATEDVKMSLEL